MGAGGGRVGPLLGVCRVCASVLLGSEARLALSYFADDFVRNCENPSLLALCMTATKNRPCPSLGEIYRP
jgi:hypothetical protein